MKRIGDPPSPPNRYRAVVPAPWSEVECARWRAFTPELARRADRARNLAEYGEALLRQYDAGGAPSGAIDIDAHSSRKVATDLLGRSEWNSDLASRDCATHAMGRWPSLLLATSLSPDKARADPFWIYVTSGLFAGGVAVPLRWQRSHDDFGERADDAIAELFNTTTRLATTAHCRAPLVSLDLGLSDHLILRLAGDDHPFAAALGPHWTHEDVHPLDPPSMLTGHSPWELFMKPGRHILERPRPDGSPVQLVRASYRGRLKSLLFYAHVPDAPTAYFLVRQPATSALRDAATRAATLATSAARLHGQRPLDDLGAQEFFASPNKNRRWFRHMTMLQAILTFSLLDTPNREDRHV